MTLFMTFQKKIEMFDISLDARDQTEFIIQNGLLFTMPSLART